MGAQIALLIIISSFVGTYAQDKGHNFLLWTIISCFITPILGALCVYLLKDKSNASN
jgi:hypothetical protein